MHERERQRMILSALKGRSVGTVQEFAALTGASEATIRRDIQALSAARRLRKVRGGAEALSSSVPAAGRLGSRPRPDHQCGEKRAIAARPRVFARTTTPRSSTAARPPSRWSIS